MFFPRMRYQYRGYFHGWNHYYNHLRPYWSINRWENPEEEKKYINQELEIIEKQKEELAKRLKDLETKQA